MSARVIAVVLAVALSGCGGSSRGKQDLQSATGGSPQPAVTQGPIGPAVGSAGQSCSNAGVGRVTATADLSKKPVIKVPDGPLPCKLDVQDIVEGTGTAAKAGDQLTMKYVGVTWATGKQFDASWDRGQDFDFTLGAGNVIQGWDQGLVGMKRGGRRQLVIPPGLGYGDQAQGADIPAGSTLVFVVDLMKIG